MDNQKLEIPCSYQGGKSRLAKEIIDIILKENPCLLNNNNNTKFYDLCCGSGAISIELINRGVNPKKIVMLDKGVFGLFYKMVGEGTFEMNKLKQYIEDIPKDKDEIQKHLHNINRNPLIEDYVYQFLLLQAGSFGGKQISIKNENEWIKATFCGYWMPTETSSRRYPRNPMMPMPETIYKRTKIASEFMKGVLGINDDISSINIEENSIVYIDPPYINTSTYKDGFDISELITTIKNCKIYVSEGLALCDNTICLSKGRTKGGISGNRKKKPNEEWLSMF